MTFSTCYAGSRIGARFRRSATGSLEQLLVRLDGVVDEADAYRVFVDSMVESLGFSYGSAWRVDPAGRLELRHETANTLCRNFVTKTE